MLEVKEKDDLEKLEYEVQHKRMTLDEAIAAIAKRFCVEPFVDNCTGGLSAKEAISQAWSECEDKMLMAAEHEDVGRYLVNAVEKEEITPTDALEFYCKSIGVSSDALVDYARDDLGFDPYCYVVEEIDAEYMGEDISDILSYLDSRNE